MPITSYKDLIVWQKSLLLAVEIYRLTEQYPKEELYGLTSQMRRASVSIPSNIAEGRYRGTKKDFAQFLRMSLGSCGELITQIEISKKLRNTKNFDFKLSEKLLEEAVKMLHVMIFKLTAKS